jgi:hypothetical protein
VSGALDAWKFRSGAAFARFWRGLASAAALASAPSVGVHVERRAVMSGDAIEVEVVIREAAPGASLNVQGELDYEGARVPVRLWPSTAPGVFHGRIIAPRFDGTAAIKVTVTRSGESELLHGEAAVVIAPRPGPAAAQATPATLDALASSQSGAYIADGDIGRLRAAIDRAFPSHDAPIEIRPMRSVWWLLPFVLCLGAEWKWRRENGLR